MFQALTLAGNFDHKELIHYLVEGGVRLGQDGGLIQPRGAAAEMGHESIVSIFLENGADIEGLIEVSLRAAAGEGFLKIIDLPFGK